MAAAGLKETVAQCQCSLAYVLATAACQGGIFLDDYTPEARRRPAVRALMTKITVELDEGLPPLGTRLNTYLKNGRRISGEYTIEKGHPDKPLTMEEVKQKFRRCVPYAAFELGGRTVKG